MSWNHSWSWNSSYQYIFTVDAPIYQPSLTQPSPQQSNNSQRSFASWRKINFVVADIPQLERFEETLPISSVSGRRDLIQTVLHKS